MLTATLPYCECHLVGLALLQPDVHVDVADILRQRAPRSLNGDLAGLDGYLNSLGNVQLFSFENVAHLELGEVSKLTCYIRT